MTASGVTAMALAMSIASSSGMVQDAHPESLGVWRITTYDVCCNYPQGRQSASGKRLEYGDIAMNGVPFGTKIIIDGEIFTVVDRCGIDGTVDIFIENDSDVCQCDTLEYKEVFTIDE